MPTTGRATIGNLPAELTSFVGRRRELGHVTQLLAESRLVTLTGFGGAGKTRLAVQVGANLRRAFADGVWLVDLTQMKEAGLPSPNFQGPDVLAFLVGATLGLPERAGGQPLGMLAEELADRQLLLILDNCEHLIPAIAIFADTLLRVCPRLRLLATSREPLSIFGEVLFAVPPLPAPSPGRRHGLADTQRYESVMLFLDRARAGVADFHLTEANCLAVAELCHRLDGLPLAIELAAARIRVMEPQQVLDRLTDRFTLLSRGSRSAPERHQTLQACMDWSFDLCTKSERILWARLSVFAGAFELDAVEGICIDEQLETDLLDVVAGLVHKSILVRDDVPDEQGGKARYRMLQTIREYGHDKLREADEDAVLRRRHRDWYQQLLDQARAEGITHRRGYWLARLRREQHNLRTAMEFCLTEPGEAEAALRLAVSVPRLYWRVRGLFSEGRRWLDHALAQATAPTALRAGALVVNSRLAYMQGDPSAGVRLLDEAEELARQVDAAVVLAYASFLRGLAAMHANDLPVAVDTLTRAWTALSGIPDLDPSLDLRLNTSTTLATATALAGDYERASAWVREAMAVVEPRGDGLDRSFALWTAALIAWLRGDLHQAAEQDLAALRPKQAYGSDDRYGTALCLELLAWITADQHRHRRAATLLGAAKALWTDVGASITSYRHLVGHHDTCERKIRDAVGDAAFAEAFDNGQSLALNDMLAYALQERRDSMPPPHEERLAPLTRREQQVGDLIAEGLSNKDIAAALVVSQRTVESHVEHILKKLGFTSRAQVAAWIAERA